VVMTVMSLVSLAMGTVEPRFFDTNDAGLSRLVARSLSRGESYPSMPTTAVNGSSPPTSTPTERLNSSPARTTMAATCTTRPRP